MAKSIFLKKDMPPDDAALSEAMAGCIPVWNTFLNTIKANYPGSTTEWKFYGAAWGWCLVVKSKKKALVYLTPAQNSFYASFIYSEKGRQEAKNSGLSTETLQIIESGKTNPAGHAFDFVISELDDLDLMMELLQIKYKT